MPHAWFFLTCLFGLLFDNCISILANTRCFRLEQQRYFFSSGIFFGEWLGLSGDWALPAYTVSSCFIDIICLSELGIFMTVDVVSDFCVLVWDQLRMEHRTCAQLSSMLEHGCGCAFLQLAWERFLVVPCWWLLHGFRLLIGELPFCFNETNYLGSSGKLWDAPNVCCRQLSSTYHYLFLTSHGLDAGSRSQDSCGKCLRKRMISATYIADIHSYSWRYLKDLHAFHPPTRLLNNPQPVPFAHASLRLSDTRTGHLFLALPWSF